LGGAIAVLWVRPLYFSALQLVSYLFKTTLEVSNLLTSLLSMLKIGTQLGDEAEVVVKKKKQDQRRIEELKVSYTS